MKIKEYINSETEVLCFRFKSVNAHFCESRVGRRRASEMAGNAIFMCAVAALMIRERAAFPSRPWNKTDDVFVPSCYGDASEAGEREKC